MKKSLILLLIMLLALTPMLGVQPLTVQAAHTLGGNGTVADPYIILTAEDLDHVRDDLAASYKVGANIDLSAYNWEPIGTDSDPFRGSFDGANYIISGLTIESPVTHVGLFGKVEGSEGSEIIIENVRLVNVNISSTNADAVIGGLIGLAIHSQIKQCTVIGTISGSVASVGGLIGQLQENSYSYKSSSLTSSYTQVKLDINGGTSPLYIGGLVGEVTGYSFIDQSYAAGNILVTGQATGVGGLIGLTGGIPDLELITNSFATGNVETTDEASVGGLVGVNAGLIKNSYAAGVVTSASSDSEVGGLIGLIDPIDYTYIIDSYWNFTDNDTLSTAGSDSVPNMEWATELADMKKQFTYVDWDTAIWGFTNNMGPSSILPYLKTFPTVFSVDVSSLLPVYPKELWTITINLPFSMIDGSIYEQVGVSYQVFNPAGIDVMNGNISTGASGQHQGYTFNIGFNNQEYAEGTYSIHIAGLDSAEKHTPAQIFTFIIEDTTPPIITLNGNSPMQITVGDTFTDPGATAVDAVDGDLTAAIAVSGTVDGNRTGSYTLTYEVSDAKGHKVSTTRTVNVVAKSKPSVPSISLSSNADLAELDINNGGIELSPSFAPVTTEYRVETTVESIDLKAVAAHDAAIVKLADKPLSKQTSVPLELGDNKLAITVQAEDGTLKTYHVTITRLDNTSVKLCPFTDIDQHWAKVDICEATALGIVEGVSANIFMPDSYVTRTEFAIMLMRTMQIGINNEAPETSFSDKDSIPAWARVAVQTAVAEGILEGYLDGSLKPERTVSRTELAIMVARAMKWEAAKDDIVNTPFVDDDKIPAWGKAYVEASRKHGLMNGRQENHFVPDGLTTRAEATVVLLRLWNQLQQ